jgi:hypothetical protein
LALSQLVLIRHSVSCALTRVTVQSSTDPPITGELSTSSGDGIEEIECIRRLRWHQLDLAAFISGLLQSVDSLTDTPPSDVSSLFIHIRQCYEDDHWQASVRSSPSVDMMV